MARILIIDDDAQIRSLLAHLLRQAGYQVVSAKDGEEGDAVYHAQPADLVITDYIMPRKSGLETITELHKGRPALPIIIMSGGHDLSDLMSATPELRSVRAIQKPFLPNELLA